MTDTTFETVDTEIWAVDEKLAIYDTTDGATESAWIACTDPVDIRSFR